MLFLTQSLTILSASSSKLIWQIGNFDNSADEFTLMFEAGANTPYTFVIGQDIKYFPGITAGPDEHPAGRLQPNENNPLTISFKLDSVCRCNYSIKLDIYDMQNGYSYAQLSGWKPPQPYGRISFEVKVNDNLVYTYDETLPDTGIGVLDGSPYVELTIPVPGNILNKGENKITINVTDGDWIIYDALAFILPKILAEVDIDPNTLNVLSSGKWITAYIELPNEYSVEDIDINTILLNEKIQPESHPTEIGDYDNDGISDLMVKFDRNEVQKILDLGNEIKLTITAQLKDGTLIEGTDTIRVIKEGKNK